MHTFLCSLTRIFGIRSHMGYLFMGQGSEERGILVRATSGLSQQHKLTQATFHLKQGQENLVSSNYPRFFTMGIDSISCANWHMFTQHSEKFNATFYLGTINDAKI